MKLFMQKTTKIPKKLYPCDILEMVFSKGRTFPYIVIECLSDDGYKVLCLKRKRIYEWNNAIRILDRIIYSKELHG